MKKMEMELLSELLKDSKRSDRELSKILRVSQATVTRTRHKLVKDGVIHGFSIMPDLAKIGFEILAISCVKLNMTEDLIERAEKWMHKYQNIIFVARAEGMGKNGVMISLHRDYTDYSRFVSENRQYWADDLKEYGAMLISLKGLVIKPLSLAYLARMVKTPEQ